MNIQILDAAERDLIEVSPITCETIPVCYLLSRCGAIYQNIRNYRLSARPGIDSVEINISS